MILTANLFIKPEYAFKARTRWAELGGPLSCILPGSDDVQLSFRVSDLQTKDGKLLIGLSEELGVKPGAENIGVLAIGPVYEDLDLKNADLLSISTGTVEGAIKKNSVGEKYCSTCDMPLPVTINGAPKLTGKKFQKFDIFYSEDLLFVHPSLSDIIKNCKGVVLTKAETPKDCPNYFHLTSNASLGYSIVDKKWLPWTLSWGKPCKQCGFRPGTTTGNPILGIQEYPRKAWNGDAFLRDARSFLTIVNQGLWKILSDPKWKTPSDFKGEKGTLSATPVYLIDNAEPIF